MTKTNYKIIELLKKDKQETEEQKTKEQKKGKEKTVKNSRMKDEKDNYDIEDDDEDDKHKPNVNYYKYKDQNNCIEANTGNTFNLITIDIDYAFLCCDLFIECFKTSSLCTLTKNGFQFHYQYDNRLRSTRVLNMIMVLILKIIQLLECLQVIILIHPKENLDQINLDICILDLTIKLYYLKI